MTRLLTVSNGGGDTAAGARGAASDLSPGMTGIALAGAFLFSLKPIFIKLNYGYQVDRITQLERLLLYTYPTFVAIIGYVLFRERLSRAHPRHRL